MVIVFLQFIFLLFLTLASWSHRLVFICSMLTYGSVFCNVVWCVNVVRSMEFPSFEIKTEADSNDTTHYSQDDEPSTGMLGFWFVM